MTTKTIELMAAAGFALLFGVLLGQGLGYAGRASYVPVAASGLGLVMCAAWGVATLRAQPPEADDMQPMALLRILLAGAAYVAGFAWLGAFTATLLAVPGIALMLGYRNLKVLTLSTLGFALILYVVFRLLLSVPLPNEALLTLFGA